MSGYDGEGFVGLGYCHSSLGATGAPTGAETSTAADWTNENDDTTSGNIDYHQYIDSSENDSRVVFVAAKKTEGYKILDPHEQQRQRQEKEAEISRLQARDIVRNILNSGGEKSTETNPNRDQDFGNSSSSSLKSGANYHHHGHYGPQEGFAKNDNSSTLSLPNSAKTIPGQQSPLQLLQMSQPQSQSKPPCTASIESDAQVARLKAMDILRKFRSHQNGGDSGLDITTPNESPVECVRQYSEHAARTRSFNNNNNSNNNYYKPPESASVGYSNNNIHSIPIKHFAQSQSQPQSPIMISSTTAAPILVAIPPPWELGRRRRECLNRDEERKKLALFKNLEYVAILEEERLKQQSDQLQQVMTLEEQIDERYRKRLESRSRARPDGRNDINTSGAGIGTKQRRKAEQKRKRTALPPSLRNNNNNNSKKRCGGSGDASGGRGSSSVAIYVSNLPTEGYGDETIRALFGSYGILRKIHFYTDKSTGKRKGDALVIYSLKEEDNEASLTESVCSQVCTDDYRMVQQ